MKYRPIRALGGLLAGLATMIVGDMKTPGLRVADGAGALRAKERLRAYRKAQADRLKDAAPPTISRQQRRSMERREAKRWKLTPTQAAIHAMGGDMPKYPGTTFVNGV